MAVLVLPRDDLATDRLTTGRCPADRPSIVGHQRAELVEGRPVAGVPLLLELCDRVAQEPFRRGVVAADAAVARQEDHSLLEDVERGTGGLLTELERHTELALDGDVVECRDGALDLSRGAVDRVGIHPEPDE